MLWDIVAFILMAGLGVALWFKGDCDDWVEWVFKYVILSALLFGPYFFWSDIAAYWSSSQDGPVNLQQSWF